MKSFSFTDMVRFGFVKCFDNAVPLLGATLVLAVVKVIGALAVALTLGFELFKKALPFATGHPTQLSHQLSTLTNFRAFHPQDMAQYTLSMQDVMDAVHHIPVAALGLCSLLVVASWFFHKALTLGFLRMQLDVCDRGATQFDTLFNSMHLVGRYLLVLFLTGVAAGVAFVVPVLPLIAAMGNSHPAMIYGLAALGGLLAFFVVARFMFAAYVLVDSDVTAVEAMRRSWNRTAGVWAWVLFFLFVIKVGELFLVAIVPPFALITLPITSLMTAYMYRNLRA